MPQNDRHPALDKILLDQYNKDKSNEPIQETSKISLEASSTEETTIITETNTSTDEA